MIIDANPNLNAPERQAILAQVHERVVERLNHGQHLQARQLVPTPEQVQEVRDRDTARSRELDR